MKSSFPKRDKSDPKIWACKANAKFIDYVLEKSFSHMHVRIYMYIFMKSSFPNHDYQTWHDMQTRFLDVAYPVWKRALHMFMYL